MVPATDDFAANDRGKEEEQTDEECGMEGRPAPLLLLVGQASFFLLWPFHFCNSKEGWELQLFCCAGLIKLQEMLEQMSSKCFIFFPNRKRAPGITNLEMPLDGGSEG